MSDFKDLFSKHSKEYAAARPSYPRALFDFLAGLVQKKELAWDCATANGQAAAFLGEYFNRVIASVASVRQIENARAGKNVHFAVFPAEKADIKDGSVNLVAVAQALHWFKFDDFLPRGPEGLKNGWGDSCMGIRTPLHKSGSGKGHIGFL